MYGGLILNFIRSGEEIKTLYKVCVDNKLFDYYAKLDGDELLKFNVIIETLKGTKREDHTTEEVEIINSYDRLIRELSMDCNNKVLSEDKLKTYMSLLSFSLIGGYLERIDGIISYLNNFYYKGTVFGIGEELVLLVVNIINYINQTFNMDVELYFEDDLAGAFASMDIGEGKLKLRLGETWYKAMMMEKEIPEGDYWYLMVFETFAILHELYHAKDLDAVFNREEVHHDERINKEIKVMNNNREFYSKYHDNFKMEKDAYDFGIKYSKYILENIIPEEKYADAIEKINGQLEDSIKSTISEEEFLRLLDQEYEKIEEVNRVPKN